METPGCATLASLGPPKRSVAFRRSSGTPAAAGGAAGGVPISDEGMPWPRDSDAELEPLDGRNPFAPHKETVGNHHVCWYLPRNHQKPGFLRWGEMVFVHPRYEQLAFVFGLAPGVQ